MAKTHAGIAAVPVLMTAGSWAGQVPAAQPLTITDITAKIGSDVDARNVFAKVWTHMNQDRQEFFLANQMRSEWLPVIRGVEFVRLPDTDIAEHLSHCGVYWIVHHLERADNVVSIWLSQRCGGRMRHYVVSFDEGEWRLGPPGTGKDGGGWTPGMGCGFAGGRPSARMPLSL